jgi:phosphatidylserine/phosphatidylglycerophosphate/cardiolipin synthase-like enzyme
VVAEQLKKHTVTSLLIILLFCWQADLADSRGLPLSPTPADNLSIKVLADGDYFPSLLELLDRSKVSIDLAMFVFKIGKGKNNRPARIRDSLIRAARRGIKVRVFLERSGYDDKLNDTNRKVAEQLTAGGVNVILESPKTTTHNKVVVIDRRYAIVGSHNFTQSALKYNHELSLLVDDRQLAEKLVSYMEESIQP